MKAVLRATNIKEEIMFLFLILLCLLSCVSGGLMVEKLSPSTLSAEGDMTHLKYDSASNTIESATIEYIADLLSELERLLSELESSLNITNSSGKMGFAGNSKIICSGVNEKYSSCNEKCADLSMFQAKMCYSSNFIKYLGACFSGNMECYGETSVTVGSCSSNCNCGTVNDPLEKIVGGEYVEHAVKYPWHVGIINTNKGKTAYCGGTIIGDMFVLTAAHCLQTQNIDDKEFSVRIGDHIQTSTDDDINNVTETICVEKIYYHPEYQKDILENDIALVQLSKKVAFKNEFGIRPSCLPCTSDSDNYAGKPAITLGWGKTVADPNEIPSVLKRAEVTILDKTCHNRANKNFNPDIHLCTTSNSIQGFPCTADYGGGLFINEGDESNERYVLVGITLSSICDETKPVIYTRVKPALEWIQNLNFTSVCLNK